MATSTNKAKLEALLKLITSATQEAIAEYEKAGGDAPSIDTIEPHPLDDATDNIALKSAVRTLEGACAQLCTTLAPPSHTATNLVNVYDCACIRVALRENITDILANYPKGLHVKELSKVVNIEAKKLVRLMRFLVTRGFYREVEADTFANNRLSMTLLTGNPTRDYIDLHVESDGSEKAAYLLYETLKDPQTAYSEEPRHAPSAYAHRKKGVTNLFYDWIKQESALSERFHFAMRGLDILMGSPAFLTRFPFEKYSTVVDIGGGIGAFSLPLAKKYNHVKITLHDLPEVLVRARGVWARDCPEALRENRIEFSDLNFFTQAPVKGKDIYYLRSVLHNWPDQEAELILRNLRQALGPHSRVLIHDYAIHELDRKQAEAEAATFHTAVAPEPLLPNFGVGSMGIYQWDILMWLLFNAKERTLGNTLQLATAAGLKLEKIWDLVETCVLEFSSV